MINPYRKEAQVLRHPKSIAEDAISDGPAPMDYFSSWLGHRETLLTGLIKSLMLDHRIQEAGAEALCEPFVVKFLRKLRSERGCSVNKVYFWSETWELVSLVLDRKLIQLVGIGGRIY